MINTGHGQIEISVFETALPPRFRLYFFDSRGAGINAPAPPTVTLETIRPDRSRQKFEFIQKENYLEAIGTLPEPHEFKVILELKHGDHGHTFETQFTEHHHPDPGLAGDIEFGDAHERAHAAEMQKHLTDRQVTTGQIILFGLTGGLLPCPSAFAVLLLCLQLKKFALGFALVLGFSIGLAITLVTVGCIAAVSVKYAGKKFGRFGEFARKAPYASSSLLILIGLLVAIQGLRQLMAK